MTKTGGKKWNISNFPQKCLCSQPAILCVLHYLYISAELLIWNITKCVASKTKWRTAQILAQLIVSEQWGPFASKERSKRTNLHACHRSQITLRIKTSRCAFFKFISHYMSIPTACGNCRGPHLQINSAVWPPAQKRLPSWLVARWSSH